MGSWISGVRKSGAGTIVCASALLVGVGLAAAPHAVAADGWVSVAWSPDEDHVHWRWGYGSPYNTDIDALNDCRKTGGDECRILASGGPCIAVMDDDEHAHAAQGETPEKAVANVSARVDPVSAHMVGVKCYWD